MTLNLEKEIPRPDYQYAYRGARLLRRRDAGAAIMGMRPIVDVQYGDFLFLASDQIINNAAKLRYMSGGQIPCADGDAGSGGQGGRSAPQHAQNMERYFIGSPGLKVVAPVERL